MRRRIGVSLTLILCVVLPGATSGQAPESCEDRLAATQVNLNATTLSQIRDRGDAAREIAGLRKEMDRLRAEVEVLRKVAATIKPPAAPAAPDEKK